MSAPQIFAPTDAPITRVVVYRDRAEISRVLRLKASPGSQDVILSKIPTNINLDSIRVDGKGPAAITEVNLSNTYVKINDTTENDKNEKACRDSLANLNERKAIMENEISLLEKQQNFWDNCADSLSKDIFSVKDGKSHPVKADTFESLSGFLQVHAKETAEVFIKLREKKSDMEKLDEEIQTTRNNLNKFSCCNTRLWSIVVSLDVHEAGDLELTFSYMARNASWNPKYDVRVSPESKKLSIAYYGVISQNTGEDWISVPLSLSTAVPAQGGTIPTLGTKQLAFKQPPPPPQPIQYVQMVQPMAMNCGFGGARSACAEESLECATESSVQSSRKRMKHVVSSVKDTGITTAFEIAKPCVIPTDNSTHKVTVGMIELTPTTQYKIVPKKMAQAFLEAKALNTSDYPILPGPASVFFGTNFVATVELKTVSPQEEFTCSLGVDPAVRVSYRPVRRFTEQGGLVNKTTTVSYIQEIEINNTRADTVHVVVVDQVPLSTEEKLKVTLIDPALNADKRESKGFVFNQDNNLEHEADINARSKYTWTIKYKVEYPADKEVEEEEVQGCQ